MKQPQLGKKIAELRQAQGLTQEELVEKCNISVRTIQRIESGDVTPRTYTIKTIFVALEYDYSQLSQTRSGGTGTKVLEKKKYLMQIAIIAGILYFIMGIPEGILDSVRLVSYAGSHEQLIDTWLYSVIKILSISSCSVFLLGFWRVGEMHKLQLLKYGAIVYASIMWLAAIMDISSLAYPPMDTAALVFIEVVLLAIGGIFFGATLTMARSKVGDIALIAGVLEIIVATCLVTFLLSILSVVLLVPTIIVEIILLYQVRRGLSKPKEELDPLVA